MRTEGPPWNGSSTGRPSLEQAFENAFANIPDEEKADPNGFVATIYVFGKNPITEYRVGLNPTR